VIPFEFFDSICFISLQMMRGSGLMTINNKGVCGHSHSILLSGGTRSVAHGFTSDSFHSTVIRCIRRSDGLALGNNTSTVGARKTSPSHVMVTGRRRHGLVTAATPAIAAPSTLALKADVVLPFIMSNIYPYYALPLLGGLILGTVVVGQLVVSGKVVGISGAVRGLVEGEKSPWRVLFVTGLLAGGALLRFGLYPDAFGAAGLVLDGGLYNHVVMRLGLAGVLVGVGTSLGNGCTSGHGICGNARLSLRSFISTCTFMLFGAVAAAVLHTAQFEGLPAGFIVPSVPDSSMITLGAGVLASAVACVVSVSSLIHVFVGKGMNRMVAMCEDVMDFAVGFFFALGLGVSGMTNTAKVAGFLSILSGTFDASLMFVMGGALLVALPGYQYVLRSGVLSHPLACSAFSLPTSKEINARLLIGSALFGCGWGAAGLCPGPGLVSLAMLGKSTIFVGAMIVGMALAKLYQKVESQLYRADTSSA